MATQQQRLGAIEVGALSPERNQRRCGPYEPPSPGANREVFARHVERSASGNVIQMKNQMEQSSWTSSDDEEPIPVTTAAATAKRSQSVRQQGTEQQEGTNTVDDSPRRRFLFPKMGTLFARGTTKPSPRNSASQLNQQQQTQQQQQQQQQQQLQQTPASPVSTGGLRNSAPANMRVPREHRDHHSSSKQHQNGNNSASPRGGTKKRIGGSLRQKPALMGPRDPTSTDQRICLILDLDETLVRSSFDSTFEADFIAPFTLNGSWCTARVRKRPFVDDFLRRVSKHFEVIVMTAGVEPYASLVIDTLDAENYIEKRFYRDSCTKTNDGLLVKDLSRLSRDLARTIVVDNSPNAYLWHPRNAIDVTDFVGDASDTELPDIAAFLEAIHDCPDVRPHLPYWRMGASYKPNPDGSPPANISERQKESWCMSDLRI